MVPGWTPSAFEILNVSELNKEDIVMKQQMYSQHADLQIFIIFLLWHFIYPSECQQRPSASFAYDFVNTSTLSATIKAL